MSMIDRPTVSRQRNSTGLLWASIGLVILTLTLAAVALIQFMRPLPPGGVFVVLAVGGVPAALAMSLGLWRGLRNKQKLLASDSDSVDSSGVRVALIGLGILLMGTAVIAGDCWRRQSQKRQWVSEAQATVEDLLHTGDRIPANMKERLGSFKGLTGQRMGGAAWNTQGYEYLVADRDAHFTNVTIPVRIYVTEGGRTNHLSDEIVVQSVKRDKTLYLIDAPLPQAPSEGLRIMVSHPQLKSL